MVKEIKFTPKVNNEENKSPPIKNIKKIEVSLIEGEILYYKEDFEFDKESPLGKFVKKIEFTKGWHLKK